MKKKIIILAVGLAVFLAGCSGRTNEDKLDVKSAVFTIEKDGKTVDAVPESYAWLYALLYKDQYESIFGDTFWEQESDDGTTYAEMFKEELIDEIKQTRVLSMEAKANDVTLNDEEKDICASNAAEYLASIEEDTLDKTGITVETLTQYEEDYTLYDKYKTELLKDKKIEIDEEEVRQSDFFLLNFETTKYDEDKEEEVPVSDKKKKQQEKRAKQAYAMLEEGEEIEAVAKKFGFDPDTCQFTTGKTAKADQDEYYDEAFETAAFALKEGQYSKVTECLDGYYIIKMITENNEEETAAAMESKEEEEAENIFTPMLEKLEDKYEVTMNEENWDKIDFTADIAFKAEDEAEDGDVPGAALEPEESGTDSITLEPEESDTGDAVLEPEEEE